MRIRRLLVANRSEIARRVFATCRRAGIETVAVFSDADADSPHVREADLAVRLPGYTPAETYLRGDLIVAAAQRVGADAVHPGYGFLSENADFAAAVTDAGLVWVGPPPKAIAAMGSKLEAKALLAEAGVPMLESWTRPDEVAWFPVLVKASAGGGGRGMRIVRDPADLASAMAAAGREAGAAFGDDTVFCERYVETGRHVEVQILADGHGTVLALGERECSIQRRHQKIVEEAPAPGLDDASRSALWEAGVAAARAVGYVGAGTVEFLLAPDGRFYFLEMNTRLQVEHPVTECVLGLDLVGLQLLVAEGRELPFAQAPPVTGHAIEVRLYAEDPAHGWRPSTGTLRRFDIGAADAFTPLKQPGVRLDSGVVEGFAVSVHYDPMLAKVIAWAHTRADAARALASALAGARIHGVVTNRDLLVRVLRSEEFLSGGTDTAFLDRHPEVFEPLPSAGDRALASLAAALAGAAARRVSASWAALPSGWRNVVSAPQVTVFDATSATPAEPANAATSATPAEPANAATTGRVEVRYRLDRDGALATWSVTVDGDEVEQADVTMVAATPGHVTLEVEGVRRTFGVERVGRTSYVDSFGGSVALTEVDRFPLPTVARPAGSMIAPMPGTVGRVAVTIGQIVEAGALLLTLEAMKLEHPVRASEAGVVTELLVQVGSQVEAGTVLAVVAPEASPGSDPTDLAEPAAVAEPTALAEPDHHRPLRSPS